MAYTMPVPRDHAMTYDFMAAIESGLIAGAAFLVLQMFMVAVFLGGNAWAPLRYMASVVMGRSAAPPPATFDLRIMFIGLILHFAIAIGFTLLLTLALNRLQTWWVVLIGAGYGVIVYLLTFVMFLGAVPWMAAARSWVTVVSHIVFGAVAAGSYNLLAHREPVDEHS